MKDAETRKAQYNAGYEQAIKDHSGEDAQTIGNEGITYCFNLCGFWYKKKDGTKDYKVIATSFDKGYLQAMNDLEEAAVKAGNIGI